MRTLTAICLGLTLVAPTASALDRGMTRGKATAKMLDAEELARRLDFVEEDLNAARAKLRSKKKVSVAPLMLEVRRLLGDLADLVAQAPIRDAQERTALRRGLAELREQLVEEQKRSASRAAPTPKAIGDVAEALLDRVVYVRQFAK